MEASTSRHLPFVVSRSTLNGPLPDRAVPLLRGHYLIPTHYENEWQQRKEVDIARCHAVHATYRNLAAFSHLSAALLHGVALPAQDPDVHTVHVVKASRTRIPLTPVSFPLGTANEGSRPPRHVELRRHLRTSVIPVEAGGLPVTDLETTLLDCLCDLPAREAFVVGDALARKIIQPQRGLEREALEQWDRIRPNLIHPDVGRQFRRGSIQARRLLEVISPLSESWGESQLRFALLKAGLPAPELQFEIPTSEGRFYADLAYPMSRLLIEFDGAGKYNGPQSLYSEKQRQDTLVRAGWSIERITTKELWDESRLLHRLFGRGSRPLPGSLTLRPWMH